MARIIQLSPLEAQKIAAGEVVERPANIVKELLENALDAQATAISVYIEDAGKALIRVADNGFGMSQEDAHRCFLPHATSKITSVNDLHMLHTFGFRGEALSSIASVSKVTLITREKEATHGIKMMLAGNEVHREEEIACPIGTDIAIHDLFYNVPARKKFLKTKETEWRQIVLLFQALCLSYKKVHFRLFHEGTMIFNSPPVMQDTDRIMQLWDQRMASHMRIITHENKEKNIQISGLITDHQYYRYDRSTMFFFVNTRWIKSIALNKALLKGYQGVLPADRYPVCVITITVDPAHLDVNIHPRKEEVKFLHSWHLESMLTELVKNNLAQKVTEHLQDTIKKEPMLSFKPASHVPPLMPPSYSVPESRTSITHNPLPSTTMASATHQQSVVPVADSDDFLQHYTLIGQLHKTYILLEHADGLLMVDQHAAHERILYEKSNQRLEQAASVTLLFPHLITLSSHEYSLVMPYLPFLQQLGIAIEPFGEHQLRITAVPIHVKDISFNDIIAMAAATIAEYGAISSDEIQKKLHHALCAQMACKAAVKAGDELEKQQIFQLLDDLSKTNNRLTCPHGRPTHWLIRRDEIEKKFKRRV